MRTAKITKPEPTCGRRMGVEEAENGLYRAAHYDVYGKIVRLDDKRLPYGQAYARSFEMDA